ncbi:MAG TPA: hypothetical protein VFF70_01115, partial [Anaerolineae bacterium]|nr:hypothetical protein [Anaerolineae bacterium]
RPCSYNTSFKTKVSQMTNDPKLDTQEQELSKSYERSEWRSGQAQQKKLQHYQVDAAAMLESDGLISISLPKEDLKAIRQKAAESGTSYQQLIANIVHQFVTGH